MPRTMTTRYRNDPLGQMMMTARMLDEHVGEIHIVGIICGYAWDDYDTDSKMVRDALNAVKDAQKLVVHISSPGGYAQAGLTMMDMIAGHNATEKIAFIEGECCSAATLLTLACDRVSMYEGDWFMIHEPSGITWGTPGEISQYAAQLEKLSTNVATLYSRKTGKSVEEMQKLMDGETWFTAAEAVEAGFATEVLQAVAAPAMMSARMTRGDMQEVADRLGYKRVPDALMRRLPVEPIDDGSDAGGAAANEVEHEEEMTMEITRETLMRDQPELYNQILDEGRQAGMSAERARLQNLDEIALPGYEQMVADAKYGEKPGTAADVSMLILREQMKTGTGARSPGNAFLESRKEETATMTQVRGQSADDNDDPAKVDDQVAMFAKTANAALSRRG